MQTLFDIFCKFFGIPFPTILIFFGVLSIWSIQEKSNLRAMAFPTSLSGANLPVAKTLFDAS